MLVPSPPLAAPGWIRPFVISGSTGVSMFFVVSAFTLSISWFSRKDGSHQTRNFYLRRVFRIVPLFYFLLMVTLLRDRYVWHTIHSVKEILLSASMLFNLVPGHSTGIVWASWTIGVEILFYMMFPLVMKLGSTPVRLLVCFSGSLVLAFLYYQGLQHSPLSNMKKVEFLPTSLALHIPVFVLGIITYTIFARKRFRQIRSRWVGGVLVAAALTLHLTFAYSGMYLGKVGANWSALAWTMLVLGLVIYPLTAIVNPVTRFYGRISYSVYLNHPLVIVLLMRVYVRIYQYVHWPVLGLLICFAATFTVLTPWAYLTYRLVEQPWIRLGSRLIRFL
jgi:peptidoglycan/LPS O-acetylase OafA/YrhL